MKNYSKEAFQASLLSFDWNLILLCNDVEVEADTLFKDSFLSIIDSVAPVKQVRIKQRSEEWIHVEIKQCINERDRAF